MKPNVIVIANYYPGDNRFSSNPKFDKKRAFYSSNIKNDYIDYIEKGTNDEVMKIATNEVKAKYEDYVDYAGNTEKSAGVFDSSGLLDFNRKKILREKLRNTKSVIWDMVISFEEEFGKTHIKSYEDAKLILEKELPHFFKMNKLDDSNICWFAGLHENTDNRHIHLSFFELEPMHLKTNKKGLFYHHGKLNMKSIEDLKVRIEEHLTSPEYKYSTYRRNIINSTKGELNLMKEYVDYEIELRLKLLDIRRRLPKGKFGYNNKKLDEIRPMLKECITYILNSNPDLHKEFVALCVDLNEHDRRIKDICNRDGIDAARYLLEDKMIDDVYRRCGNEILGFLRAFEPGMNNYTKTSKIKEKSNINMFLKKSAQLTRKVNFEAINCLEDFKRRLRKAEIEILKEKGEIEIE